MTYPSNRFDFKNAIALPILGHWQDRNYRLLTGGVAVGLGRPVLVVLLYMESSFLFCFSFVLVVCKTLDVRRCGDDVLTSDEDEGRGSK
jgi:hypothetical protein